MHSDIANYIPRGAKNISPHGIQVGLVTSDQIGGSNVLKPNEFSVRSASVHDAMIMESIEREAFPELIPSSRISRDITRDNGLYLNAVREWRPRCRQHTMPSKIGRAAVAVDILTRAGHGAARL